jgi:hypothetical protein
VTRRFQSILAWNERFFHTSSANTSPNFVRQIFFFHSGKIRNQMVDNKSNLIVTNLRNYKPYFIGFFPFKSWMKKEKMKT